MDEMFMNELMVKYKVSTCSEIVQNLGCFSTFSLYVLHKIWQFILFNKILMIDWIPTLPDPLEETVN